MKFSDEKNKFYIDEINNKAIDDCQGLVHKSEKHYRDCIDEATDYIINHRNNFILLTGPSSSGKTTTSIFLQQSLIKKGKKAVRISLDNFYKNRDDLPFWEDGSRNFEAIEALDLDTFSTCLYNLTTKGVATFPVFDFQVGKRSETDNFSVKYDDEDTYIIFEGIHALNPMLIDLIHSKKFIKMYVSAHSDFYMGDEKVLPQRLVRLMRRIMRDKSTRNTEALVTLDMWQKVVVGEDKYIFPYRDTADWQINSTHAYEPLAYKSLIMSILRPICDDATHGQIITKCIDALEPFVALGSDVIPKTSLLREFVV
jgi:uridine kinase